MFFFNIETKRPEHGKECRKKVRYLHQKYNDRVLWLDARKNWNEQMPRRIVKCAEFEVRVGATRPGACQR